MRVGFLSCNAPSGNAIGNQLAEKVSFFLERGAEVRVFLDSDHHLHPALATCATAVPAVASLDPTSPAFVYLRDADLIFVEYSQYFRGLELLPLLAGGKPRIIFDYHSVTPPALWGAHNREGLEQGIRQRGLVWCADFAIAHSRFTERELIEVTRFPRERQFRLGYVVDTDWFVPLGAGHALGAGLPTPPTPHALGAGLPTPPTPYTLLLYVGRVAPNKRLPVLIEAVAHLRDHAPPVHAVLIGDRNDLYQEEATRCEELARSLGVAERIHFVGQVDHATLRAAYQAADVFVMPSRHEGFCIPVIEAMACGVPVVAARATALPETVADAGLTFTPDDAGDLARQLLRILDVSQRPSEPPGLSRRERRIAVVAARFGTGFVGGAESSLRTIARALHQAGHHVEVWTTCADGEDRWQNRGSEGTEHQDGIPIHRFVADACDQPRFQAARLAIDNGRDDADEYLATGFHSRRLIENLQERIAEFDAVIAGPYLTRLTYETAVRFPGKTLLLPCFHDEPLAHLPELRQAHERVGAILYHSIEEEEFAEAELGLNHPGAVVLGTVLEDETGDSIQGWQTVAAGQRYLVYAGRYAPLKGLPTLLEWARRWATDYPERFRFVFLGQGPLPIPKEPWACDLGYVDAKTKNDVLAGADALILLSKHESLSLVALEAWAQGTPVIAHGACEVLAGHLRRGGGGRAIETYEDFAAALDDLWQRPDHWQSLGAQGRAYVRANYESRRDFVDRLQGVIESLNEPLADQLRRRGRQRAGQFSRLAWREQFAAIIDEILHAPANAYRFDVEVRPTSDRRTTALGTASILVPVRVTNRGTHALVPASTHIRCAIANDDAGAIVGVAPLPGLLAPGQSVAAAIPVCVPSRLGSFCLRFWVETRRATEALRSPAWGTLWLEVVTSMMRNDSWPQREAIERVLLEAGQLQHLPDDYLDISTGWLAQWKRRLKAKLLNNFKQAYVDVLSRQQSAFNREVLSALQQLTDYCATLEHALAQAQAVRERCAALEQRLAELESRLPARTEADALKADLVGSAT